MTVIELNFFFADLCFKEVMQYNPKNILSEVRLCGFKSDPLEARIVKKPQFYHVLESGNFL